MVFKFVLDFVSEMSCLLAPLLQVQIVCHALVSVLQEHFGHGQNHDLEMETVFSPGPSFQ